MKVLKIIYKTYNNELVREISFNRNGLSVVVANIINNENLKESTNGVGKTILMKTIDYVFGANSDKTLTEKLSNYYFEAIVLINNEEHTVKRYFEKNGKIFIDDLLVSIEEYKQKLDIDRSTIRKLILLNIRNSISETPGIAYNINDLSSIFKLLNLEDVSKNVVDIKSKTDELNGIRDTKKKLLDLMETNSKEIDVRIAKNKDELEKAKSEEKELRLKINSLDINEENNSIQKQFEIDNNEIKKLRKENYILETEKTQLNSYLNMSSGFLLTSDEIKDIYEEAGLFIQNGVLQELSEAEKFYKMLVEDRSKQINKRLKIIDNITKENNAQILFLSKSLSDKSAVLSKNDAYQNALVLMNELQSKLENLNVESGRLDQYSKLEKRETDVVKDLTQLYIDLNIKKTNSNKAIESFKTFVRKSSEMLYEDDSASFSADFKSYKEKGLPCAFSIDFRKSQSGGVSLVKNALFDFLLFKFDLNHELLLHDSICFGDIDKRQVATLLNIGNNIAIERDKQYIVALNKDSVHESVQTLVNNKMILELSEDELLLNSKI